MASLAIPISLHQWGSAWARGRSATEPKRGGVWFDPQCNFAWKVPKLRFPFRVRQLGPSVPRNGANLVEACIIDAPELREVADPGDGGAAHPV